MTEKQRAAKLAWHRQRFEARKAEGVCVTCGDDLAPESRWRCRRCLDANAALQLRKRSLRPVVRFCACGTALEKGRQLCEACRLAAEARRKAAAAERGRVYQQARREEINAASRARRLRLREAGICYSCGEPCAPFVVCRLCRLARSRRRKPLAAGRAEQRAA